MFEISFVSSKPDKRLGRKEQGLWAEPAVDGQVSIGMPGEWGIRMLDRLTHTVHQDWLQARNRHTWWDRLWRRAGEEATALCPKPDFPSSVATVGCISSVLTLCSSYAGKAALVLIRPHIHEKFSQAQMLEVLLLGKLRVFAYSWDGTLKLPLNRWDLRALIQGPPAGQDLFSLKLGPPPFFFIVLSITKIKQKLYKN